MGFRSYIRHFLRAILMPFRPSLPWCFPIRELPFEQREQQEQEQQQQKEEKVAQIILFDDQPYGFRFRHDQPSFKKNMVVSVNEGTPLKKNTLDWDSPWKDHSAIDATSIGDPPFMETQKVGCHLGSGKSHHFTSVPLVQRNPMMITHTPKKKKWGACVSKWKMIPPKQQFDRFWYCKYWNQIGIDGLSSY